MSDSSPSSEGNPTVPVDVPGLQDLASQVATTCGDKSSDPCAILERARVVLQRTLDEVSAAVTPSSFLSSPESEGSDTEPTSQDISARRYIPTFAKLVAQAILKRGSYSSDGVTAALGVLRAVVDLSAVLATVVSVEDGELPLAAALAVFDSSAVFYAKNGHPDEAENKKDAEGAEENGTPPMEFFQGWQELMTFGDRVDIKHPRSGRWVEVTVQSVDATRFRVYGDAGGDAVSTWVEKASPDVAPGGTYSAIELKRQMEWRKSVAVGDVIDFRATVGWVSASVLGVRNCHSLACPGNCRLYVEYQSRLGAAKALVERHSVRVAEPGSHVKTTVASMSSIVDEDDPKDVAAVFRGDKFGGGSQFFSALVQRFADAGGFDGISLAAAQGVANCTFTGMLQDVTADGEPGRAARPVAQADDNSKEDSGKDEDVDSAGATEAPGVANASDAGGAGDAGDAGDAGPTGVVDGAAAGDVAAAGDATSAGDAVDTEAIGKTTGSGSGGQVAAVDPLAGIAVEGTGVDIAFGGMAALEAASDPANPFAALAAAAATAQLPPQEVTIDEVAEASSPVRTVPVSYVQTALLLLSKQHALLARPFAMVLIPRVVIDCLKCTLSVDERGLRTLKKSTVSALVSVAGLVLQRVCRTSTASRVKEQYRLAIALMFVRSGLLERQLEGLQYIVDATKDVRRDGSHWLRPTGFASWVQSSRLLVHVFSHRSHYELLKRCAEVLKFLLSHDLLENEQLDVIWAARNTSDEATVFAVMDDLLIHFRDSHREHIAVLITSVPPSQVTIPLLDLVQAFCRYSLLVPGSILLVLDWLWGLVQDGAACDQLSNDVFEAALERLQKVLTSASSMMKDFQVSFVDRCCAAIKEHESVPQALSLMRSLLDSFPTVSHAVDDPSPQQMTRWAFLNHLVEKHDIFDALFDDLAVFHRTSAASNDTESSSRGPVSSPGGAGARAPASSPGGSSSARSPASSRTPKMMRSPSLQRGPSTCSKTPVGMPLPQYLGQLQARLDFLSFYASNCKHTVSVEQADALWTDFVVDAASSEERKLGFKWFTAACDRLGVRGGTPVFAPDVTSSILESRIAVDNGGETLRILTDSDAGFDCLRRLFLHANSCKNRISVTPLIEENPRRRMDPFRSALAMRLGLPQDVVKDKNVDGFQEYKVLDFDLMGLGVVWHAVVSAASDNVATTAMGLLKELLDNLAPSIADQVEKFRGRYVTLCMEQLKEAREDGDVPVVARCVELLHSLLDQSEVEGLHGLRSHSHRTVGALTEFALYQHPSAYTSPFQRRYRAAYGNCLAEDTSIYHVKAHAHDTVYCLREAVAEVLGVPMTDILLFVGAKRLPSADNGKPLSEVGIASETRIGYSRKSLYDIASLPDMTQLLTDRREPKPLFRAALENIWARFRDPENDRMDAAALVKYFAACGVAESSWEESRLRAILTGHKHVKNDEGQPCLVWEGFLRFYMDAAECRTDAVWNDLIRHGYRLDLSRDVDKLVEEREQRQASARAAWDRRAQMPRFMLSHRADYFGALFELLGEEALTADVWELIMRLPTNPYMAAELSELTVPKNTAPGSERDAAWASLLDPSSPLKLLYSLQIVEGLAEHRDGVEDTSTTVGDAPAPDASEEAKTSSTDAKIGGGASEEDTRLSNRRAAKWCHRFLKYGGFQHVLRALMALSDADHMRTMLNSSLLANLSRRCVALLLKVARYFLVGAMSVPRPDMLQKVRLGMHGAAPSALTASMAKLSRQASVDSLADDGADVSAVTATPTLLSLSRQLSDDETFAQKVLRRLDLPGFQSRLLTITSVCAQCATPSKSCDDIVSASTELWMACVLYDPQLYSKAAAQVEDVFEPLVHTSPSATVREGGVSMLCTLVQHFDSGAASEGDDTSIVPGPHLLSLASRCIDEAPSMLGRRGADSTHTQLFTLLNKLLSPVLLPRCVVDGNGDSTPAELCSSLLRRIVAAISARPIVETFEDKTEDVVLVGLLTVLGTLVACPYTVVSGRHSPMDGLAETLFHDFLFARPLSRSPLPSPPKCKAPASRAAVFRVLLLLAQADSVSLQKVLGLVETQENTTRIEAALAAKKRAAAKHGKEEEKQQGTKGSKDSKGGIRPATPVSGGGTGATKQTDGKTTANAAPTRTALTSAPPLRSSTGFVGLRNLGCTCYMNSLLQQMYMIPEVRYGVLAAKDESENTAESPLAQLQNVFAHLETSALKAYVTWAWVCVYVGGVDHGC